MLLPSIYRDKGARHIATLFTTHEQAVSQQEHQANKMSAIHTKELLV